MKFLKYRFWIATAVETFFMGFLLFISFLNVRQSNAGVDYIQNLTASITLPRAIA